MRGQEMIIVYPSDLTIGNTFSQKLSTTRKTAGSQISNVRKSIAKHL